MKELEIGRYYKYEHREGIYIDVELLSLKHPTNEDACAVRVLSDNTLQWANKSVLVEIRKDTSHLKGLFEELKIEIEKASSCEKYDGVVFVHPDDVESVVSFIFNLYSAEYNSKRKTFTFGEGGVLILDTLERDKLMSFPQHDYAGFELTTVLIHNQCFGKYYDGEYKKVNERTSRSGGDHDFIWYMLSRLRSESKYSTRFVYV